MATFEPIRTRYGWSLTIGELTLEVESPHFDRGAIRAALTARNGTALYYRDIVNLTSARARSHVLRRLAEKDVTVDERAIVALDEACRTRPAPPAKVVCDGGGNFSEKVIEYRALLDQVTSWLLLRDPDALPTILGAMAAHRFGGSPVWLLVVAPPSGTKTELLRATWGLKGVYPLSELTARTFASGLETHGDDPSLLSRLRDEVLILKDFTTVLEIQRDERQAILAQLREIYDGRFDKAWGTGKELHWEGRLGFVAGVTPIIDSHHAVLSVLGERFLMLRMMQPDRQQSANKALDNAAVEAQMRQALAGAVRSFMAGLPEEPPQVPHELRAQLADFVTRCRSGVVRNYRSELEYAPEPEMPARVAKQLFELLRGMALVMGHREATQEDLDRVRRVALDCIPAVRHMVLRTVAKLLEVDEDLTTTQVAQGAQYSTGTVRRALEDLQALGILGATKRGQGKSDQWHPRGEWAVALDTLKKVDEALTARVSATFSEKFPPPSHTQNSGASDAETPAGDARGTQTRIPANPRSPRPVTQGDASDAKKPISSYHPEKWEEV